jgi:hypothetical protein
MHTDSIHKQEPHAVQFTVGNRRRSSFVSDEADHSNFAKYLHLHRRKMRNTDRHVAWKKRGVDHLGSIAPLPGLWNGWEVEFETISFELLANDLLVPRFGTNCIPGLLIRIRKRMCLRNDCLSCHAYKAPPLSLPRNIWEEVLKKTKQTHPWQREITSPGQH